MISEQKLIALAQLEFTVGFLIRQGMKIPGGGCVTCALHRAHVAELQAEVSRASDVIQKIRAELRAELAGHPDPEGELSRLLSQARTRARRVALVSS